MEPDFRSQYEARGRTLTLRGIPVREMSRDELLAVIGFLFEQVSAGKPQDRSTHAAAVVEEQELEWEYPPSNDGLFEG